MGVHPCHLIVCHHESSDFLLAGSENDVFALEAVVKNVSDRTGVSIVDVDVILSGEHLQEVLAVDVEAEEDESWHSWESPDQIGRVLRLEIVN